MAMETSIEANSESPRRQAWNKGKLVEQKPPLRPKHVWSIRTKLQMAGRIRELALFNLAIDSKLRGCDVVALKVEDVAPSGYAIERATVRQKKTGQPVKFELTEQTARLTPAESCQELSFSERRTTWPPPKQGVSVIPTLGSETGRSFARREGLSQGWAFSAADPFRISMGPCGARRPIWDAFFSRSTEFWHSASAAFVSGLCGFQRLRLMMIVGALASRQSGIV
jgi:hypothetical protein